MRYFPVNLDLQGKSVVVIGGGEVAARKVGSLIESGAQVRVIAPEVEGKVREWARARRLHWRRRVYRTGDLAGAFAAVAATDDRPLNLKIRAEATRRRVLLNIVDKPDLCDFVFPSRVQRGEFLLTISTGGGSPALSKWIREQLEVQFGPEYGELVSLLSRIRAKIPSAMRRRFERQFGDFVRSPVLSLLRKGDQQGVRRLVRRYFGNGR